MDETKPTDSKGMKNREIKRERERERWRKTDALFLANNSSAPCSKFALSGQIWLNYRRANTGKRAARLNLPYDPAPLDDILRANSGKKERKSCRLSDRREFQVS